MVLRPSLGNLLFLGFRAFLELQGRFALAAYLFIRGLRGAFRVPGCRQRGGAMVFGDRSRSRGLIAQAIPVARIGSGLRRRRGQRRRGLALGFTGQRCACLAPSRLPSRLRFFFQKARRVRGLQRLPRVVFGLQAEVKQVL